jgi:uncharacterized membrane protein YozB (DUF420 family)
MDSVIFPWDEASTSTIYSISAFSALCFCALLLKIRTVENSSFFVRLSLMLIASQVFFVLFVFYSYKVSSLVNTFKKNGYLTPEILR